MKEQIEKNTDSDEYIVDDRESYTEWIKYIVDNMTDEEKTEYYKSLANLLNSN